MYFLMRSWRQLIDAGFIPFTQWGDGWGPMCFDAQHRASDGDCPIVWLDHERLIPPEICLQREQVMPWVQPLYGSCREFLEDVFVRNPG
jgi:hypothetical protein